MKKSSEEIEDDVLSGYGMKRLPKGPNEYELSISYQSHLKSRDTLGTFGELDPTFQYRDDENLRLPRKEDRGQCGLSDQLLGSFYSFSSNPISDEDCDGYKESKCR
jgi:hypothetical protein